MHRLPGSSIRILGRIALLALVSGASVHAQVPGCDAPANPTTPSLQRSWLPVPAWTFSVQQTSKAGMSQQEALASPADKDAKSKGTQTSFTSCYDECYWASLTCPSQCGATPSECAEATQVCYSSCSQGVGPWLPC